MKARIEEDLKSAMKGGDTSVRDTLRMLKSEIKNSEIESKSELSDDGVIGMVSRGVKKRRESIRMYEQGGRPDLVEKESKEVEILLKYLPEQISEEEIRLKVRDVIGKLDSPDMKQMGKVMKDAMAAVGKNADGALVSRVGTELLQAQAERRASLTLVAGQ